MTDGALPAGLWLIGLGPGDLGLMTADAIEHARACEHRFLEGYTATLPSDQESQLESLIGPWHRAMRPQVEDPAEILALAQTSPVALLVVGDPMQATTHIDLEAHCDEQSIEFSVIPGLSATSLAVSLSGLQSYRFGRQVTLPFAYGDYLPTSPLELIDANYRSDLHTLVLLDLDPTGMGVDQPQPMSPLQAVELLQKMAERLAEREGETRDSMSTPIAQWDSILLSDLGTPDQRVVSGNLEDIAEVEGGRIHCLILPAEFSGLEREAYERRKGQR
ncbi:MAG: diphthine synthase [Candidatus Thalassarchaeaceae archaeon]|nr:diphthine synthase [Candidatus Thalassarchaeaceae archaeon]